MRIAGFKQSKTLNAFKVPFLIWANPLSLTFTSSVGIFRTILVFPLIKWRQDYGRPHISYINYLREEKLKKKLKLDWFKCRTSGKFSVKVPKIPRKSGIISMESTNKQT